MGVTIKSSLDCKWSNNGTSIYYNTGNVGIGTDNPTSQLMINSDSQASFEMDTNTNTATTSSSIFFFRRRGTKASPSNVVSGDVLGSVLCGGLSTIPRFSSAIQFIADGTIGTKVPSSIQFLNTSNSSTLVENMRITYNGKVGIGTTNPPEKLSIVSEDIGGNAPISLSTYESSAVPAGSFLFNTSRGTVASPQAIQTNDVMGGWYARGMGATAMSFNRGYMLIMAAENWTDSAQGTKLRVKTTTIGTTTQHDSLFVGDNGNVGIGTITPTSKLSIIGLPTSSAGLNTGDIWIDTTGGLNIVKIV